jgi:hypothetical protein
MLGIFLAGVAATFMSVPEASERHDQLLSTDHQVSYLRNAYAKGEEARLDERLVRRLEEAAKAGSIRAIDTAGVIAAWQGRTQEASALEQGGDARGEATHRPGLERSLTHTGGALAHAPGGDPCRAGPAP